MEKHPRINKLDLSRCRVFLDFDNTITTIDVLDDLVKRFAKGKEWLALERAWRQGEIGSEECLAGQLGAVRITKGELRNYLSHIKIDPYFHNLLALLRRYRIRPVILSDSFSFIIKEILRSNRIKGLKIYCNRLRFAKNKLLLSFPYRHKTCFLCAHCKKNNLLRHTGNGKITIYIGDGLSDTCPARQADLVFAKGSLLKHFRKIRRSHVPIKDLGDVYKYLRGCLKR